MKLSHKAKKNFEEDNQFYIDLGKRKVTEFEDEKLEIMDKFIKDNKSKFLSNDLQFSSKLKK